MKKIALLGSTGSIGTQALDVIRENKDRFKITALACGKNIKLLREQIIEFSPGFVAVAEEAEGEKIASEFPQIEVGFGEQGLIDASEYDSDMVLNALVGIRGLIPTVHAIEKGRDIALANKEALVAGGEIVMKAVKEKGVRLLPVDSEHSAIFQCLEGNRGKKVRRVILTASGGPFKGYSLEDLKKVTLEQALCHPRWNMGKKITIDSATMMNKGFEVIEAKWLFGIPVRNIEIHVHPQSIIHSAVEFGDASVLAQLAPPDMRIPISVALGYPERLGYSGRPLDLFSDAPVLTFEKPDTAVFRCIKLAYKCSEAGGSYPVALNAANEVLVERFLRGELPFIGIQENLERIIDRHKASYNLKLDDVLRIDEKIRREV